MPELTLEERHAFKVEEKGLFIASPRHYLPSLQSDQLAESKELTLSFKVTK